VPAIFRRPVEPSALPLAWPVVHSAAEPPLPPPRRFQPPWATEETDACFIVRDANGQQVATFLNCGGSLFGYASPPLTNGLARTAAALGIRCAG